MMFFGKKSIVKSGLLEGFTDYHSHILPGVDDGVKTTERALEVLDWYEQQGVKRVVFTPHIMEDCHLNTESYLRERFDQFSQQYSGAVELSLAAEYMIDAGFKKCLDRGDLLTLHDDHLLVECSFMQPPISLYDELKEVMSRGYFVVLAHPERYLYLSAGEYEQLKAMGVLFQMNLLSIVGAYGKEVVKRSQKLLDLSMYDIVGSDLHRLSMHQHYLGSSLLSKKRVKQLLALSEKLL